MAKKRLNKPKLRLILKKQKEKTKYKLITETAFLPNVCYAFGFLIGIFNLNK